MVKLSDMMTDGKTFANGLKQNATQHRNYKRYTSMERALAFLLDGRLYISNGKTWNDTTDSKLLQQKEAYAVCFSCSTRENIAMWMLYGGERGRNGALLNFYPSVMEDLLHSSRLTIGKFRTDEKDKKQGKYVEIYQLTENKDYELFLTDVVYTDACKNDRIRITVGDTTYNTSAAILNDKDIFKKNYAWAYEKECRLVIRLKQPWKTKAQNEGLDIICITLNEQSLNRMRKRGIVRSPVYDGGVEIGEPSALTGTVKWVL